jgi:molybdate transport system regulatory protein
MEIRFRVWIEKNGEHVIGKGGAQILRAIREEGSISSASKKLGMSYKYMWNYLKRMENAVGKVVESEKGGRGGGRTRLTEKGEELLNIYESCEKIFGVITDEMYLDFVQGVVKGEIVEVENTEKLKEGEVVLILRKKDSENFNGNFWSSD